MTANYWREFLYVDVCRKLPAGGMTRWERLPVPEVPKFLKKAGDLDAYATMQRFRYPKSARELQHSLEKVSNRSKPDLAELRRLKKEMEGIETPEVHYAGPFYDFDSDAEKLGLSFDKAIEQSQQDAHRLCSWYLERFKLRPAWVQVWFSGRKGFHVVLRPEPFGIAPSSNLTAVNKFIAEDLQQDLELQSLDMSIYSLPRMWRLPSSRHSGTGLFKTELNVLEFGTYSAKELLKRSEVPQR